MEKMHMEEYGGVSVKIAGKWYSKIKKGDLDGVNQVLYLKLLKQILKTAKEDDVNKLERIVLHHNHTVESWKENRESFLNEEDKFEIKNDDKADIEGRHGKSIHGPPLFDFSPPVRYSARTYGKGLRNHRCNFTGRRRLLQPCSCYQVQPDGQATPPGKPPDQDPLRPGAQQKGHRSRLGKGPQDDEEARSLHHPQEGGARIKEKQKVAERRPFPLRLRIPEPPAPF
jgi:hypothetical protein